MENDQKGTQSGVSGQSGALRRAEISCDQVAWVNDALDRYAEALRVPRVGISRSREAGKLACLLEIMEVLFLEFADDSARGNAVAGFRELRKATQEPHSQITSGLGGGIQRGILAGQP